MCFPAAIPIAMAASALASVGGAAMSASAQSRSANAIAEQNRQMQLAQNQGFTQRMQAANAQTATQTQVMNQTMADRNAAFTQMRQGQTSAMQQRQAVLAAENQQADVLRQTGDTAANTMLSQTSAPALAGSQDTSQQQAAALLASSTTPPILGPTGTDPNAPSGTTDSATQQATARRLAEAATNIRSYGSKVGAVTSYQAPLTTTASAIAGNQVGIMPAQTAEKLLDTASPIRLLPSQVAYTGATNTGAALDALIQSRGQSGLDAASLLYGNTTGIADITQQDIDTLAANKQKQTAADAAAQASLGGIVSGVGNLGLYAAGYYGGGPKWLTPKTAGVT